MNRQRNDFLNDAGNAQKFMDEKRERAKELIYQILAVTAGWDVIPENPTPDQMEWAQGHFLELLEIFMIRHDNFSRSTLAEDLQFAVFHYSFAHDDAYRVWREKTFAARNLDDNGEQLETPREPEMEGSTSSPSLTDSTEITETSEPTDQVQPPRQRSEKAKEYIREVSEQVALAFESKDVSDGVKAALKSIIIEASTEADLFCDDMSLIREALPNIIENLNLDYGRGYLHAIGAILRHDTNVYETYLDNKKKAEKVLDISEHPENLNLLANQISAIMKNPDLPDRIYNCLADELAEIHIDTDAPENILANLKSKLSQNA